MVSDESYKLKGIVIAIKANFLIVEIDQNQAKCFPKNGLITKRKLRILCTLRSRLRHRGSFAKVGDIVFLESIDWKENRAVVSKIKPRRNLLTRPPVANVNEVVVVLSLKKPAFDFKQASRFLLTAEKSSLKISLILTKKDLIPSQELEEKVQRLKTWGYNPLAVSIRNGDGIEAFIKQRKNCQLSVLCGPSGVGKSSLLHYLLPKEKISIGDLSGKLQRGRNITRHVQLYSLGEGSLLADTPGFNRPDLQVKPFQLQMLFPELRAQINNHSCRFRNCLHSGEPGCVVDTNWERYMQYKELLEEMINYSR